jgi:hypothetical protein
VTAIAWDSFAAVSLGLVLGTAMMNLIRQSAG